MAIILLGIGIILCCVCNFLAIRRMREVEAELDFTEERVEELKDELYRYRCDFNNLNDGVNLIKTRVDDVYDSAKEANEESIKSNKLFQDGLTSILNYDAVVKHD